MLLGDNEHFILQFRRAQTGMDLQEHIAWAFRVKNGLDPSFGRLPHEHLLLHPAMPHVLNALPPPVVVFTLITAYGSFYSFALYPFLRLRVYLKPPQVA